MECQEGELEVAAVVCHVRSLDKVARRGRISSSTGFLIDLAKLLLIRVLYAPVSQTMSHEGELGMDNLPFAYLAIHTLPRSL